MCNINNDDWIKYCSEADAQKERTKKCEYEKTDSICIFTDMAA